MPVTLSSLKCIFTRSPVLFALVVLLSSISRADDDPAKAIQSQFAAARMSLAAGDLSSAESHYIDTIAIGLRQQSQLALAAGELDQAINDLDSALKIKPGDIEVQVDAATLYFRKGEVAKSKALLLSAIQQSAMKKDPQHARAHG